MTVDADLDGDDPDEAVAEANDDVVFAEEPNTLFLDAPLRFAKGDDAPVSLPKLEAVKALAEVCLCSLGGALTASTALSAGCWSLSRCVS